MPKSAFRIFSLGDFVTYVRQTLFERKIRFIQNHHTWRPDYHSFYDLGLSPMVILENMRNDHIQNRGWDDIGQNITVFPDGTVGLCRTLELMPAGIRGANVGAICIENLGNFDKGGDGMTSVQQYAVLRVNAILCIKFDLAPEPNHVVYHHWFDSNGSRFSDAAINSGKVENEKLQKSCPGTNFFLGNTIDAAKKYFYPLVGKQIAELNELIHSTTAVKQKKVAVDVLNVRSGRGMDFPVIRKLTRGLSISIYDSESGWARISANTEEWVSEKFLS